MHTHIINQVRILFENISLRLAQTAWMQQSWLLQNFIKNIGIFKAVSGTFTICFAQKHSN